MSKNETFFLALYNIPLDISGMFIANGKDG